MKKIILMIGIVTMLSSCLVTSVVGAGVKVAGAAAGAAIGASGKLIGAVIGGKDGEIKAKESNYKYSNAEVEVGNGRTVVTGTLKNQGKTQENVILSIPCYNENGAIAGVAVAITDRLEKNKEWNFSAILESEDVKSCNIKKSNITAD